MTAWFAIVVPICLIAKCALDFMVMEYGSKFKIMTDGEFMLGCTILVVCALVVDFCNFLIRRIR